MFRYAFYLYLKKIEVIAKSVNCADGGQTFTEVLLYGHEKTLIIFEVLLIAVLDLLTHNYFLDIAITFVIVEVCICFIILLEPFI